jgi:predicted  nucleic acid-binding Zn-ribbon protein
MIPFNSHHIKGFNQKCKHLVNEGKIVMTHKELRDLNHEIMDLLLHLNDMEIEIETLKSQVDQAGDITIDLDGKSFK